MATTIEQIQQLLQEVGPSMPEIDAVVQTEEPSWAIQFSDETILIIEPADDPARMVISAELGVAAEAQQCAVYETLLCYNLLWKETGGVKIGLAGPQGALLISTDVCLDGMTLMELQEALNSFLTITRSWTQYVAKAGRTESTEIPPLPAMGAIHLQA